MELSTRSGSATLRMVLSTLTIRAATQTTAKVARCLLRLLLSRPGSGRIDRPTEPRSYRRWQPWEFRGQPSACVAVTGAAIRPRPWALRPRDELSGRPMGRGSGGSLYRIGPTPAR